MRSHVSGIATLDSLLQTAGVRAHVLDKSSENYTVNKFGCPHVCDLPRFIKQLRIGDCLVCSQPQCRFTGFHLKQPSQFADSLLVAAQSHPLTTQICFPLLNSLVHVYPTPLSSTATGTHLSWWNRGHLCLCNFSHRFCNLQICSARHTTCIIINYGKFKDVLFQAG